MGLRSMRALSLWIAIASFAGCTKVATSPDAGFASAPAPGDAGSDHTTTRHAYTHSHELRFAVGADIKGLNPLTGASVY